MFSDRNHPVVFGNNIVIYSVNKHNITVINIKNMAEFLILISNICCVYWQNKCIISIFSFFLSWCERNVSTWISPFTLRFCLVAINKHFSKFYLQSLISQHPIPKFHSTLHQNFRAPYTKISQHPIRKFHSTLYQNFRAPYTKISQHP
jgi:hypothetical protein